MTAGPRIAALLPLVFLVSFTSAASAQASGAGPTVLDSYRRAKELIDRAVQAHGGLEVLNNVHVRLEGRDIQRHQSRRVSPPYDTTRRAVELWIDLPRGPVVSENINGFPGDFHRGYRFVTDSASHYFVDLRQGRFTNAQYPPAAQQIGNLYTIPQGYLRVAAEGSSPLRRYIGRLRLPGGAVVDAVTVPQPPGSVLTLGFDPSTHLLRGVLSVGTDLFTGDTDVVTEFLDYRPLNGVLLPARARTLAPGKPIRYVIPTHHHADHFSGVRQYATAGVTTVTTPGNADYFRRVVSAPLSVVSASPSPATPGAPVELVAGKRRVFTDGSRTVEIHDVGPNGHADEMLVAWLPNEGILFQGDLIEATNGMPGRGHNAPPTKHLADFITRHGWDVRTFAGSHEFLASPQAFQALVHLPIVPPR